MAVLDQVLGIPDLFQAAFIPFLGLRDAFKSIRKQPAIGGEELKEVLRGQ